MPFFVSDPADGSSPIRLSPIPWSATLGAWARLRLWRRQIDLSPGKVFLGRTLDASLIFVGHDELERNLTVWSEDTFKARAYLETLLAQHVLTGGSCIYLDYAAWPSTPLRKALSGLEENYRLLDSRPSAKETARLSQPSGRFFWHIRGLGPESWQSEKLERDWLAFLLRVAERRPHVSASPPLIVAASASTATNNIAFRGLLSRAHPGMALLRARKPGHEYFDGAHNSVFLGELHDLLQFWPSRLYPGKDPHVGAWWAGRADPSLLPILPAVLKD